MALGLSSAAAGRTGSPRAERRRESAASPSQSTPIATTSAATSFTSSWLAAVLALYEYASSPWADEQPETQTDVLTE